MRASADGELVEALFDFLRHSESGWAQHAKIDDAMRGTLLKAMPGLKERAKTLNELAQNARFLFEFPEPDEKARQLLNPEGIEILQMAYPALAANADWTASGLDKDLRRFAELHNAKLGKVAQPIRAALTGSTTSPGIFDVMEVLGREESLRRIERYAKTGQTVGN
jgi:glutamyl-tRNA synthetase